MNIVKCSNKCILELNTKKCQLSLKSTLLSKRQIFCNPTPKSNNDYSRTNQFIVMKLTDIGDQG